MKPNTNKSRKETFWGLHSARVISPKVTSFELEEKFQKRLQKLGLLQLHSWYTRRRNRARKLYQWLLTNPVQSIFRDSVAGKFSAVVKERLAVAQEIGKRGKAKEPNTSLSNAPVNP